MRVNFLFAILVLSCKIYGQEINIDSLEQVYQNFQEDSLKWKVSRVIGDYYLNNDLEKSEKRNREYLQLAEKLGERYVIEAKLNLAALFLRKSEFDSLQFYSEQSLILSRQLNLPEFEARSLSNLGTVLERKGKFDKAIDNYELAITKIDTPYDSAIILNNMALANSKISNYDDALVQYLLGIEVLKRSRKRVYLQAILTGNIGGIYITLKKPDSAIVFFNKSLEIRRALDNKRGQIITFDGLGFVHKTLTKDYEKALFNFKKGYELAKDINDEYFKRLMLNEIISTYLNMGNWEAATPYVIIAQELIDVEKFPLPAMALFNYLAEFFNKTKDYKKAIKAGKEGLNIVGPENFSETEGLHYQIYNAEKKLGNFEQALIHLEAANENKDTLYQINRTDQLAEVEAKYQNEKKENQIALLEKNKELQVAQIAKSQSQNLILLIGLITLMGLGGLFYYRNRLNQQLKLQSMRSQISSDLHDEIGSSLTHLSMIMNSVKVKEDESSKKYFQKGNEVLTGAISKIRDVVWAIDARNDQTGDLLDRMEDFAFDMLKSKDIDYQFTTNGLNRKTTLPPLIRQNIYLIFKEAMTNIVKHSNARKVSIDCSKNGTQLRLNILDNGSLEEGQKVSGSGLSNMELRAKRIDASLKIEGTSKGFAVSLELDVPKGI